MDLCHCLRVHCQLVWKAPSNHPLLVARAYNFSEIYKFDISNFWSFWLHVWLGYSLSSWLLVHLHILREITISIGSSCIRIHMVLSCYLLYKCGCTWLTFLLRALVWYVQLIQNNYNGLPPIWTPECGHLDKADTWMQYQLIVVNLSCMLCRYNIISWPLFCSLGTSNVAISFFWVHPITVGMHGPRGSWINEQLRFALPKL